MRVMVQAQAQTKAQLQHVTMLLQDLVLRIQEVEPLLEAQTKAQLQHVKRTALLEAQTQAQCHAGASMLSAQNDVVAGPNAARDEASHNSFTTNDGIRPPTTASGSRMTSLLEVLPGTETVHQALPVHVPARSREAGVEAETLTDAEVDDRVAELLRRCLHTHGGEFDPSRISSKALGQEPGEDKFWNQLNKLLPPEGLRPFIERNPEFSYTSSDANGMLISWAPSSASASGTEQPASAPAGVLNRTC